MKIFTKSGETATRSTANVVFRGESETLYLPVSSRGHPPACFGFSQYCVDKVKGGCRWRSTGTRTGAAGTCWKETASAKTPHASQISRYSWYRNAPSCWLRAPLEHTWWVQHKPSSCGIHTVRDPATVGHIKTCVIQVWALFIYLFVYFSYIYIYFFGGVGGLLPVTLWTNVKSVIPNLFGLRSPTALSDELA